MAHYSRDAVQKHTVGCEAYGVAAKKIAIRPRTLLLRELVPVLLVFFCHN